MPKRSVSTIAMDCLLSKRRRFDLMLLALMGLILASPRHVSAQGLALSAQLLSAANDANAAMDTLGSLSEAASDALSGRRIATNTSWSDLGERFSRAAGRIKSLPEPGGVSFDGSVTPSDLANCHTRVAAIGTLNRNLTSLQAQLRTGQQSLATLDHNILKISRAKGNIAYLIKVHEQLMKLPEVGTIFALDWFDLQTSVTDGLAEFAFAYQSQRTQYAKNLTILEQRLRNFQSNLNMISGLKPCLTPGRYIGTGNDGTTILHTNCDEFARKRNVTLIADVGEDNTVSNIHVSFLFSAGPTPGCWYYSKFKFWENPMSMTATAASMANDGTVTMSAAQDTIGDSWTFTGRLVSGRVVGRLNLMWAYGSTLHEMH